MNLEWNIVVGAGYTVANLATKKNAMTKSNLMNMSAGFGFAPVAKDYRHSNNYFDLMTLHHSVLSENPDAL